MLQDENFYIEVISPLGMVNPPYGQIYAVPRDEFFFEKFRRRYWRCSPVPIPNTAVKPSKADGTTRVTERESR